MGKCIQVPLNYAQKDRELFHSEMGKCIQVSLNYAHYIIQEREMPDRAKLLTLGLVDGS